MLLLRTHLAKRDKSENPISWLNGSVEKACSDSTLLPRVLSTLAAVFRSKMAEGATGSRRWILELMGQIRSLTRTSANITPAELLNLFDAFAAGAIVLSRVSELSNDECALYATRELRREHLFLSVARLVTSENAEWKGVGPQLCEWMLYLSCDERVPREIAEASKECLAAFKEDEKYPEASMWSRLVPV